MTYVVKVDMPNLAPGQRVQVHGLGSLENGKTVRISDEQHEMFRQLTGRPEERDGKTEFVPGPALDEVNLPEGITVTAEGEPSQENEGGSDQ